ncbi:MAG: hypothetical protein LBO05_13470 [Deltaproteobacteria bacterium]|jgi:predicted MPP superfamily phosphohydrolase|nr:hypothetical protein [Deltaproteobacteria bacterium]
MLTHPLMPILMLLGQVVALLRLRSMAAGRGPKIFVTVVFVLMNALAAPAVWYYYYSPGPPPTSRLLWSLACRPGLVWEASVLVWLLASGLAALLAAQAGRLWSGKKNGYNSLFREAKKSGRPRAWQLALLVVVLALGGVGYARRLAPPAVTEATLSVPGLNPELRGLKIALISDVRYGRSLNLTELAAVTSLAASKKPDLVVLAGGLVDRLAVLGLDYRIPLLSLGTVPLGAYAVLGPSDNDVDSKSRLVENLAGTGLRVLVNRRERLPGLPVTLAGFDDPGGKVEDGGKILDFDKLAGDEPGEGDLLIAVRGRPAGLREARAAGASLYLSGPDKLFHIRPPAGGGDGPAPGPPWLARGLAPGGHLEGGLVLYLTGGLAGDLPARLLGRPEIALLTLTDRPRAE